MTPEMVPAASRSLHQTCACAETACAKPAPGLEPPGTVTRAVSDEAPIASPPEFVRLELAPGAFGISELNVMSCVGAPPPAAWQLFMASVHASLRAVRI